MFAFSERVYGREADWLERPSVCEILHDDMLLAYRKSLARLIINRVVELDFDVDAQA